jgi:hypothetical protein
MKKKSNNRNQRLAWFLLLLLLLLINFVAVYVPLTVPFRSNGIICQNGGNLTNGTCVCLPEYNGILCENMLDDCDPNPCLNGGSCMNGLCTCLPGFTGPICATNINECSPNPCLNGGSCTDGVNSFNCTCAPGYFGPTCASNTDECSPNQCLNGATCVDGMNSFSCICLPGYSGPLCATNIDECSPNPCQNGGSCTDGINSFTCTCAPGFTGPTCATNIDECSPNQCLNGATCVDGINSFSCTCLPGYTGPLCATNIDECSPNPCQNGGSCTDGVNSFTCTCAPGFTGPTCAINIDDCIGNMCQNAQPCVDGINAYTCSCSIYYTGLFCETGVVAGMDPMLLIDTNTTFRVNITGSLVNSNFNYYQLIVSGPYYSIETPNPASAPLFSYGLVEVNFAHGLQNGDYVSHLLYDGPNTAIANLIANTTYRYATVPSILIGFDTQLDWTGSDYAYYPLQIGGLNGTVVNNLAEYLDYARSTYFQGISPRSDSGILGGFSALSFTTARVGRPDKYFIFTYHVSSLLPLNQPFYSTPQFLGWNALLPITYSPETTSVNSPSIHNTDIDWGDGTIEVLGNSLPYEIAGTISNSIPVIPHNYGLTGVYTIRMAGFLYDWSQRSLSIRLNFGDPVSRIGDVLQWGNYIVKTMDFNCLFGAPFKPAAFSATDVPNPSIERIDHLYAGCPAANLDVSAWNFPLLISAIEAFENRNFVSSVAPLGIQALQNADGMFKGATFGFAGLVGTQAWPMTSITNNGMFRGAIISAANLIQIHPGGMTRANRMFRDAFIANFDGSVDLSTVHSILTNIDELFFMTTFTIPATFTSFTFASTTSARYAFFGINNLGSLATFNWANLIDGSFLCAFSVFPTTGPSTASWQFPALTNARGMFTGTGGAAFTVDSTNWGMQSIQILDLMFRGTYNIAILNVASWNTATLQTAAQFVSQSTIATVDISSWTTSQMTNFDLMFESASTVVVGVNTLNTASAMTTNNMFYRYSGSTVDVSGYVMDSVFSASVMFAEYIQGATNVATWNTGALAFANSMFEASNANPNIAGWNVGSLQSADRFLAETFISQTNYDTVLVKLNSAAMLLGGNLFIPRSNTIITLVPFAPASIPQVYTNAIAGVARQSLIDPPEIWIITDGGPV